jgi:hypothetical protein
MNWYHVIKHFKLLSKLIDFGGVIHALKRDFWHKMQSLVHVQGHPQNWHESHH